LIDLEPVSTYSNFLSVRVEVKKLGTRNSAFNYRETNLLQSSLKISFSICSRLFAFLPS
jgi:hypothetical protein